MTYTKRRLVQIARESLGTVLARAHDAIELCNELDALEDNATNADKLDFKMGQLLGMLCRIRLAPEIAINAHLKAIAPRYEKGAAKA